MAHFRRLEGKTVAIWGLAFKPRTDDMREAPAIGLVKAVMEAGAMVQVYDPQAMVVARKLLPAGVSFAKHSYGAVEGADCLAIITEWSEFRRHDFDRIRRLMKSPVVFDGRNILDPREMAQNGFTYYSIGRRGTSAARPGQQSGDDVKASAMANIEELPQPVAERAR
jgi:UDPglucose 6-dehydrogenase